MAPSSVLPVSQQICGDLHSKGTKFESHLSFHLSCFHTSIIKFTPLLNIWSFIFDLLPFGWPHLLRWPLVYSYYIFHQSSKWFIQPSDIEFVHKRYIYIYIYTHTNMNYTYVHNRLCLSINYNKSVIIRSKGMYSYSFWWLKYSCIV
jgi:hypothetical protein